MMVLTSLIDQRENWQEKGPHRLEHARDVVENREPSLVGALQAEGRQGVLERSGNLFALYGSAKERTGKAEGRGSNSNPTKIPTAIYE